MSSEAIGCAHIACKTSDSASKSTGITSPVEPHRTCKQPCETVWIRKPSWALVKRAASIQLTCTTGRSSSESHSVKARLERVTFASVCLSRLHRCLTERRLPMRRASVRSRCDQRYAQGAEIVSRIAQIRSLALCKAVRESYTRAVVKPHEESR